MYYGGFSFSETMQMPVTYKRWFIERISKEINGGKTNDSNPQPLTKAIHQNSPDIRALQGKTRQHVPAKLRRF